MTPETLEGHLIAQRKLLAMIIAELAEQGGETRIWDFLEERSVMQDHQEDPGAVPTEALAIEAAVAEEMSLIADAARRHRNAIRRG